MPECNFKLRVEIPVALLFFAFTFTAPIYSNLIIFRTCYVILGYNVSECEKLGTNDQDNSTNELEKKVQPYANMISMTDSLISQIVPVIIALFLGPWSDRNGRKPVMLAVLSGMLIGYLIMTILSSTTNVSPWFFIIVFLPSALFGGFTSFFTAILCYITDTSEENDRGLRMGVLEIFSATGILIGTLTSSFAFDAFGYLFIYAMSASSILLAVLYVYFLVPESVILQEDRDRKLFVFTHIKDIVKTTFKPRENFNRILLYLIIMVLVTYAILFTSDGNITFMYLRGKFDWSVEKYTIYQGAKSLIGIFGTFIGVYMLHKLLNIPESTLIILCLTDLIIGYFMMAFATNDTQIYIAGAIRCLGGVITPMIRSIISKLIPSEEIGKIFSLTVILETLIGLIGTPLYTLIYNNTISTLPGVYNLVSVSICSLDIILTMLMIAVKKLTYNYTQFESVIDDSSIM